MSHNNNINALWDIVHSVQIGDIIIAKLGRDTIVGKGIVESDYYYDDTFSKEMPHLRKVHWLLKGNWVLKNHKFAIKTLTPYNNNHRLQEILSLFENEEYLPSIEEYTPALTVKDWTELLKDKDVFSDGALNLVNALYDIGGEATCTELAEQYGNNFNYYNSNGTYLAKRVHQKTNCPIYTNENGEKRLWAIPFIGRKANNEQSGIWIWKLRDELYQALTDLRNAGTSSATAYSKTDFLNDVYMPESDYDDLCGLILTKKNVILQGPPGVGKTFAAKRLAYSIMGEKDESRLEFVQFHQNYSYEDFVMGYRPQENSSFKLTEGVFYKFCKKAETDNREHFFIIDEINRGNLSKIFGELLMLIENDKRGDSGYSVKLTYKDESFSVPENVYIIGMMNTADRSIAMIDYALRRRFSFFDIKPAFDNENFMRSQNQQDDELFKTFVRKIKELNSAIIESLGKGYCIGHSYLCGIDDITEERLKAVARYDIIPLLEEYWFDDEDTLEKWKGEINGLFR